MKKSIGAKTVLFPYPVFIIGTYDEKELPNIMSASWGGICCSEPPCIAISIRKSRYTYNNIIENKSFTVNIPSEENVWEADYVGIYSGKDGNKFESLGLTPIRSELVNAPYVEEFPIALECKLLHTLDIGIHTQFVGEIMDVKVDDDSLLNNGLPDIKKIKPLTFDYSSRSYYSIGNKVMNAFSALKGSKK